MRSIHPYRIIIRLVQGIYKKIDKFAVEFVMDSLRSCGSKAVNIRAVILTSLYNAVMTTTSYFTNLYAYHSANPQSIRGWKGVTRLRELRIEHGYTQLELAQKLGISLRTYQRIEYGEQKPNVHVVIRLQDLFQKDIGEMIKENDKWEKRCIVSSARSIFLPPGFLNFYRLGSFEPFCISFSGINFISSKKYDIVRFIS